MRALALLVPLLGVAYAQDFTEVVDAALELRRATESRTLEGPEPITLNGVAIDARRVRTVASIEMGAWRLDGPLRIESTGYGRRRVLSVSGDAALRWNDLDLGKGPLTLRAERGDWQGRWRGADGIATVEIDWSAEDTDRPPIVARVSALDLSVIAGRWLRDTPFATLAGRASAELLIEPTPDGFAGAVSVNASPTVKGKPIGDLLIDARRAPGRAPQGQLALRGPAGIIEATATFPSDADAPFTWSGAAPLALKMDLQSIKLAYLSKIWPVLALAGRTYGTVLIDGTARKPRVSTSLLTAGMAWRGEAIGRFVVGVSYADGEFAPSVNWDGHTTINGRIPGSLDLDAGDVTWNHTASMELTVRARGLTPKRLRPIWKAHPAADFSLDLDLDASNPLKQFAIRGALSGELKRRGHPSTALSARLLGDGRIQQIELRIGDDVLAGKWTLRAPLLALREGRARWAQTRLKGAASLALPLAMLAPYIPRGAFDPRGTLTGAVDTTGTLGQPQFSGAIDLKGGAITFTDLAQRLVDIEAHGTVHASTLTLDALSARSGIGALTGQGSISLQATPMGAPADLPLWSDWRLGVAVQLRADRFPFIHDTLPNGTFDTDLTIDALLQPGETRVQAAVRAAKVRLTAVRMPSAQAIPHHRAVRSLDWTGAIQTAPSVFAGDGKLTVAAVLDEPVQIEGDGVDMQLTGALTIRRDGHLAETEGGFEARPGGTFTLFENAFVVESGGLRMNGGDLQRVVEVEGGHAMLKDPDKPVEARPLEPIIALRAHGQVTDTVVDVAVVGPGRRPELILQSDPPLPEYRILTLLITGRVDAVDGRNGDVRRQVAKLVSRFHNPSLARQLYDRLGVDKLGLGFGSSVTNPILTVGKQINRQLYLETVYHHDAPPDENEKEVHVEYRLNPRWTLDTVYGDAAKGSVGVFWKTTFGRAVRPSGR